jgi:hypothetical protein
MENEKAGETTRLAHHHGWIANRDGKQLTENPHQLKTAAHARWEQGWIVGARIRRGLVN